MVQLELYVGSFKYPANICLFKLNNRHVRTSCGMYSVLVIKTTEQRHSRRSGVFIVNFELIWHLVLVFSCQWRSTAVLVQQFSHSPPNIVDQYFLSLFILQIFTVTPLCLLVLAYYFLRTQTDIICWLGTLAESYWIISLELLWYYCLYFL